MSDSLTGNCRYKTFNVMDDCSTGALAIEVDISISSRRVISTLDWVIDINGMQEVIRVDNGPEFTSKYFESWAKGKGIYIQYIQPRRPMHNGYIERFNCLYREVIFDAYLFFDLDQVRKLTQDWIEEYNLYHILLLLNLEIQHIGLVSMEEMQCCLMEQEPVQQEE